MRFNTSTRSALTTSRPARFARRTRIYIYLSLALLLTAASTLPLIPSYPSSAHAQCGEPGNEPCDVYPVYYQVLYAEPDWTIYHPADRVATVSGIYNQTLFTYQWYVIPYTDTNQNAQMVALYNSGPWDIDWYVSSYHTLFHIP